MRLRDRGGYGSLSRRRKRSGGGAFWTTLFLIAALAAGGYLLVQTRLGNGIQLGRNVRTPTPAPEPTPTRSVNDFVRLADEATARGDYRAAIDYLEKAARRRPNDPDLYRQAARLLVFIGRPAEAEKRARKALEIDPNHLPSRAVLCLAMEWQKRIAEAVAECQAVVEADPTYATGHAYLAEALADQGNFEAARAAAQTAVDLEPDNPDALRNLGYVYDVFGQYDTALYHYQRALERNPNMPHVLTAIGRIFYVTGQTSNAIKTFERIISMDSKNAEAYEWIGRIYRFIGERQKSKQALDTAIEIEPLRLRALTERALLNFQQQNYFGSVEDYTAALTATVASSSSLTAIDFLYYGFAYRWIQECDQAIKMWDRAVELDPNNEEIKSNVDAGIQACNNLRE